MPWVSKKQIASCNLDPVLDAKPSYWTPDSAQAGLWCPLLINTPCLFPTVIWHVFWNHAIFARKTQSHLLLDRGTQGLHCLQGQDQRSLAWPPEPSGLHWLLPHQDAPGPSSSAPSPFLSSPQSLAPTTLDSSVNILMTVCQAPSIVSTGWLLFIDEI